MIPIIDDNERYMDAVRKALVDAPVHGAGFMYIRRQKWRAGVLFRWGSAWIGAHWSPTNRRLCVNLIPFVTVWVCPPGGVSP